MGHPMAKKSFRKRGEKILKTKTHFRERETNLRSYTKDEERVNKLYADKEEHSEYISL